MSANISSWKSNNYLSKRHYIHNLVASDSYRVVFFVPEISALARMLHYLFEHYVVLFHLVPDIRLQGILSIGILENVDEAADDGGKRDSRRPVFPQKR